MSDYNSEIIHATDLVPTGEKEYPRKPYKIPQLQELGDLRTFTLGFSGGVGDSGHPGYQRPFP